MNVEKSMSCIVLVVTQFLSNMYKKLSIEGKDCGVKGRVAFIVSIEKRV